MIVHWQQRNKILFWSNKQSSKYPIHQERGGGVEFAIYSLKDFFEIKLIPKSWNEIQMIRLKTNLLEIKSLKKVSF